MKLWQRNGNEKKKRGKNIIIGKKSGVRPSGGVLEVAESSWESLPSCNLSKTDSTILQGDEDTTIQGI